MEEIKLNNEQVVDCLLKITDEVTNKVYDLVAYKKDLNMVFTYYGLLKELVNPNSLIVTILKNVLSQMVLPNNEKYTGEDYLYHGLNEGLFDDDTVLEFVKDNFSDYKFIISPYEGREFLKQADGQGLFDDCDLKEYFTDYHDPEDLIDISWK